LGTEFNEEQRQVFCVFSGEGVNKFRNYLNEEDTADNEADTEDSDRMITSVYEDGRDRDDDGVVGMMESAAIEGDDFDDE
jgi:F-box and leucine-rich repeat protein GRR1